MFNDFMSLDVLATFTGITATVILITQFTKSIVKKQFGDSAVRLYSFVIALILSFVFTPVLMTASGIILTIINAIAITIAATGGYELIADPLAKKSIN